MFARLSLTPYVLFQDDVDVANGCMNFVITDTFSIWPLLQMMFLKQVYCRRCRTPTAKPWHT